MAPQLPSRKQAGDKKKVTSKLVPQNAADLPIMKAQEIELDDGTRIPVKIPEGMPTHQAQALLAYLQANPEAAKQVHAQAQEMMKTPGMAQAFLGMQQNLGGPEMAEKYKALKDDPELKHVFDDVIAEGPAAFQKYWDDAELMTKISAKMRGMEVGDEAEAPRAPPPPSTPPATLHDAAKRGDIAAAGTFLTEGGVAVDHPNERGITALGVAVGFNQPAMVTMLLEKGAQVDVRDPAGNTALHYAAGYGRKQVAELLLAAGADVGLTNKAGQRPVDAAIMNKEKPLMELLQAHDKGGKACLPVAEE
eukprot:CAMPEP_0119108878 /NCGR_PEP_ID=MMETSP1180-20130426/15945_1 /TAXON_ID=3052 ORGANISM="Chlamydomonas cf sp, Strain CCMP681" /NCGR_SAMPLE_ID=MMETSP1180 /ASSEMBLY_ACC=CAM_ASM_000741 /LENGTH=305 /DNA_ID=CAMNT_0007094551 /DNA_START=17 /DNA_END=934 /DNA_ORIENTATION=+